MLTDIDNGKLYQFIGELGGLGKKLDSRCGDMANATLVDVVLDAAYKKFGSPDIIYQ